MARCRMGLSPRVAVAEIMSLSVHEGLGGGRWVLAQMTMSEIACSFVWADM